jgi:hypothetical protein
MNYLTNAINIMKKMIPKDPPKILGRWNIDYCNTKVNNKIDLSNEDHCGPCGQYALIKQTENTTPSMHIKSCKSIIITSEENGNTKMSKHIIYKFSKNMTK